MSLNGQYTKRFWPNKLWQLNFSSQECEIWISTAAGVSGGLIYIENFPTSL
jgi:hypothetical protein